MKCKNSTNRFLGFSFCIALLLFNNLFTMEARQHTDMQRAKTIVLPPDILSKALVPLTIREQTLVLRVLLKDIERKEKNGLISIYADYKAALEKLLEDRDKKRNELGLLLWGVAANSVLNFCKIKRPQKNYDEYKDEYKKGYAKIAQRLIDRGAKLNVLKGGMIFNGRCLRWTPPRTTLGIATWLEKIHHNPYLMQVLINAGSDSDGDCPLQCVQKKSNNFQEIELFCELVHRSTCELEELNHSMCLELGSEGQEQASLLSLIAKPF